MAEEPSYWVHRFAHLVPSGGTVLDVAAGGGRHARFFHDRGHPIVAVDRTLDGLADLADAPGIELVAADIEADRWPFEGRRFAGIVVTNYLHRPLLPILAASVEDGGAIIYETFAVGQAEFGRPSNPDFLLKPGELLAAFADAVTIVAYEHGILSAPRPKAVQRIAAIRGRALASLSAT